MERGYGIGDDFLLISKFRERWDCRGRWFSAREGWLREEVMTAGKSGDKFEENGPVLDFLAVNLSIFHFNDIAGIFGCVVHNRWTMCNDHS
jgi:hypothetical protein